MKKLLAMILCVLMLTSCLALYAFAAEETTAEETTSEEATTEAQETAPTADRIVFNSELAGKPTCVTGMTGLAKGSGLSKTGEWDGMKIAIKDPTDPNFTVNYKTYCKKYNLTPLTGEEVPFIVMKFYVPEDSYYDDFELFYCAGSIGAANQEYAATCDFCDEANGFVYFIYNLEDAWSGEINQFRIDPIGADEECVFYLMELAMFKSEEEAIAWCGFEEESEEETTEEQTEAEVVTTEKQEESEIATAAPVVKEEGGCGSVIGAGIATVCLIALGAVCIKKKD